MNTSASVHPVALPTWLGALGRAMNIGIILLDSSRRVSFANESACELAGAPDARALARQWPDLRRRVAGLLDRAVAGQPGVRDEQPLGPRGAGRRLEFEVFALPAEEAGGYLLILRNRGFVRALDANLRHASKMRGLTRLLSTATHELKAPMNAIALHMALLCSSIQAGVRGDSSALAGSLDRAATIEREVQRLDRTLCEVLDLARVRPDRRRRFDVGNLMRETVRLLVPVARDLGIELQPRIPTEPPMPIFGRRDRLKQALLNVLLNALEATPRGGEVAVDVEARRRDARIRVRDSGPGIPPEVLARVWDLHFTTKDDGSGIGLHVSRSVVEDLGGAIDVVSVPGEGAMFTVALPLLGRSG